jgi:glucose/sorbosone dehydrogenase
VKLVAGLALCLATTATTAQALSLQQIGSGFQQPIYVTSDPGNPERLFVVERAGSIALVQNGEVRPFADISSQVSCCGETERGLLSIAFAPDFDSSGRFYLYYTGKEEPGEIHIAEMTAADDSAPTATLHDLIPPIPHPEDANHYGGQLQIGPEGDLFASTGDGGGKNDEHHNAQDPGSLLGKILRVRAGAAEVWSLGLRNPFRFSFDRQTGSMWIGDVGQSAREEVDLGAAPGLGQGANYGWNCLEGSLTGPSGPGVPDPQCAENSGDFVPPVFEYPHADPGNGGAYGCAIIGGYVARGPGLGDLYGRYLYGDLCVGELRSFSLSPAGSGDRSENLHVESLNSFGEDSCGRLYAVSGGGPVFRLVGPGDNSCSVTPPPPTLNPTYVGIRAVKRRVKRNRRGLIVSWVAPCPPDRRGDPVTLWRGRQQLGTRHLDRVCSARFRPKINRRSNFRVTVKADSGFNAAISRQVTIRPKRHNRH